MWRISGLMTSIDRWPVWPGARLSFYHCPPDKGPPDKVNLITTGSLRPYSPAGGVV